jgi:hypothetical protein
VESIGQKFLSGLEQGRIPSGAHRLRSFAEHAQAELDEARLGFDLVVSRDNGPQDLDPRPGRLCMELGNSHDGGYRSHRYEATYEGSAEQGSLLEMRHFPATEQGPGLTDAHWTRLDGQTLTQASFLQREGEDAVQLASAHRVDAADPGNSQTAGWSRGFDAAALEKTVEWQLLD